MTVIRARAKQGYERLEHSPVGNICPVHGYRPVNKYRGGPALLRPRNCMGGKLTVSAIKTREDVPSVGV